MHLLLLAERRDEATRLFETLVRGGRAPPYDLALGYAHLDRDLAFEWLHKAID